MLGEDAIRKDRIVGNPGVHPSPDLIQPCIRAGCPAGGTVLDPFGGSGTTGEVAASEGRKAILVELNPEYVKLAENRGGLFLEAK